MKHTAEIFDIQRNSFVDGPGIRTTVFFKGCNLRCRWCHNPEGQSFAPEMMFFQNKCTECGKCKEVCPQRGLSCSLCGKCALACPNDARKICGERYTVGQVMEIIEKDRVFYEASNGGATFSGGECMLWIDFLSELLKACREKGVHTAVDTAGNVAWESFERVLPHTDLFLYDVKCVTPEKHLAFTGADNGLILDNLARLFDAGAKIWVRIPLIPGFNCDDEEMQKIKALLADYAPEKIEILPYHAMGGHKYDALGRKREGAFSPPSEAAVAQYKKLIEGALR